MEDKEIIKILTNLLQKYPLEDTEKEAVKGAIGILSWSKLFEGYVERKKKARDRRLENDESGASF